MHKVRYQLGTVRGVHDFGVKLHGIKATRLVGDGGVRRVLARRDHFEAIWQARHAIAVAHPDLMLIARVPDALEQGAWRLYTDRCAPKFAMMAALDRAAKLNRHRLLAIADAEHGHASGKHFGGCARTARFRHRRRPPRQDHGLGL